MARGRCLGREIGGRVDAKHVVAGALDARADCVQQLDHHLEIAHRRHIAKFGDTGHEQGCRHLFEAGILRRAGDLHDAFERAIGADPELRHGRTAYVPE
jgi:hypothetical protein